MNATTPPGSSVGGARARRAAGGLLEQLSFDQRLRIEVGTPGLRYEGRYAGTTGGSLALATEGGIVYASARSSGCGREVDPRVGERSSEALRVW